MSPKHSNFDHVVLGRLLDDGLAELSLPIDAAQRDQLMQFVELLHKWNGVYNLTAVREPQRMISHHLLDSLSIQPHLVAGIPLAIINPERSFLLVDSNSKKTRFMRQAVGHLGLENVDVFHGKAQDYPAQPGFDTVMCRALASVPKLLEIGGHLLNNGGRMVAQKGLLPDDELAQLTAPWQAEFYKVEVPMLNDKQRHVVILSRDA